MKTVTVKRDPLGDLYVYFSCLVDPQPIARAMTGKSAVPRFNRGIMTSLTSSDGATFHAPQPFKRLVRTIGKANRQLSSNTAM